MGSAVCAIRERCDLQSVGLPNAAIRRQVVCGRGPQSVRYANGMTHSQWVSRMLRSADMWSATGSAVGETSDELVHPNLFNRNRSTGLIQPDSFNWTHLTGPFNRTRSTRLVQPDSFNRIH